MHCIYANLSLPTRTICKLGQSWITAQAALRARRHLKRSQAKKLRRAVKEALRGNPRLAQKYRPGTSWDID